MRWWRATAASALLLGVGAGMIVLPTALLGGLAAGRRRWHPSIRAVLGLVAAAPAAFVARDVWSTFPGLRGAFAVVVWFGPSAWWTPDGLLEGDGRFRVA